MQFIPFLLLAVGAASNVLQVSDTTFNEIVLSSGVTTLVDFYATWCRHCKNLMPVMEELGNEFSESTNIQIVKIDGDGDGKRMRKKYKVAGYPTLLLFTDSLSHPITYNGLRDQESLSNFIKLASRAADKQYMKGDENSQRSVMYLSEGDLDLLENIASNKKLVLVQHKQILSDSLLSSWNELAQVFGNNADSVKFVELHITDPGVLSLSFDVSDLPVIIEVESDALENSPYVQQVKKDNIFGLVEQILSKSENGDVLSDRNAGRLLFVDKRIRFENTDDGENLLRDIVLMLDYQSAEAKVLFDRYNVEYGADLSMLPYYQKIVAKILANDESWLKTESDRLQLMLGSLDMMTKSDGLYAMKRANILKASIVGRRL